MTISTKSWIRITIINLFVVATLGVLMRYKIGFEFPFFDQKNIQHAHSHFAFSAWISLALMVLIVHFFKDTLNQQRHKYYKALFLISLILSYLMMLSFAISGYSIPSIVLSTLGVFVSFVFARLAFLDLNKTAPHPSVKWFKSAVILNVLSSIGTFALAYMMASKSITLNNYLGSVYWYLHFQYNGWFFFALMGLFIIYLKKIIPQYTMNKSVYLLMVCSIVPTYGLSVLWVNLPVWAYSIVVLGTISQSLAWFLFLQSIVRSRFLSSPLCHPLAKILFGLVLISLTIKLSLQLASVIPAVSKLAFGYRPIVIAYLHLVLLACFSIFIIAYALANSFIRENKASIFGIAVFVIGVFLNELVLGIQSIASFTYIIVPHVNLYLFSISVLILVGISTLVISQFIPSTSSASTKEVLLSA
jgi:hypothetical protein